jgi:hypothetical protein
MWKKLERKSKKTLGTMY